MASLAGKTDMDKFKTLSKRTYGAQAKWFLNCYWADGTLDFGKSKDKREKIWTFCQNMVAIDPEGAKGAELKEFDAHRFLEKNTEALTWNDMRNALKELDIDYDKKVSLTEFLVHEYKVDWKKLVNSMQSVTKGAAKMIAKAEEAVANAQSTRDLATAALLEAEEGEATAVGLEAEAKAAHELVLAAEAEVKAILDKITGYQNSLKDSAAKFQAIIDDPEIGLVKKMKAKHELMDLQNGSRARRKGINECNPEMLSKAKIDQKAAVRKAKRLSKVAKTALDKAEAARKVAEGLTAEAAAAVEVAGQAMEVAKEEVKRVMSECKGAGEGTVWWMGRELKEQAKYLPKAAMARLKRKLKKKVAKMKGDGASKD